MLGCHSLTVIIISQIKGKDRVTDVQLSNLNCTQIYPEIIRYYKHPKEFFINNFKIKIATTRHHINNMSHLCEHYVVMVNPLEEKKLHSIVAGRPL